MLGTGEVGGGAGGGGGKTPVVLDSDGDAGGDVGGVYLQGRAGVDGEQVVRGGGVCGPGRYEEVEGLSCHGCGVVGVGDNKESNSTDDKGETLHANPT